MTIAALQAERASRPTAWLLSLGRALVLACLAWAATGHAQTLEDIDVRTQGDLRIVRIRFNASVSYMQIAPSGASDLYTVRFELLSADEPVQRQVTDEFRRLKAGSGLPEIAVTYTAEPTSRVKQLGIKLGSPLLLQARQGPNARSIELLVRATTPALTSTTGTRRYVVRLQTVPQAEKEQMKPVPKELEELEVLSEESVVDGVPSLELKVGYFASRQEADAARTIALARFPQAQIIDLATGQPVPVDIDTQLARPDAAATLPETERDAGVLIVRAREELAAKHADTAVAALDQLLKLPPNSHSVEAQELIGNAWELAEIPARARAEYELYLKLYPKGEGAARVARRLAALGGAPVATAESVAAPAVAEPAKPYTGTIAQYYYGGKARSKSLVNIATGIDQSTISRTTESAIVTSLDFSARWAGKDSETRGVIRGSTSTNLLSTSHSSSSIGAAYVEHRRSGEGLAIRAGRQSPISGGLLGLFDGVSVAYPVGGGVRLDVMGGVPASTLVTAPSERLFAAVVEADTITDRWGGNFYLLDQTTQGITNRRALGAEARYSGDQWSTNLLADYDTVFAKVNAISIHGSFQAGLQTTVTVLVDERRAPSLQLTNALISSGAASLKDLLQTRSLAQVRDDAVATSAIARQFLVSVSRPLDTRWQLAADLRYSAIGALPAVGDFEATAATGGQVSFSAQATGTNLYSKRDINNFNLSVIKTPFFKGIQLAYNNLTALYDNNDLTLEPSIRYYTQKDNQDVKLTRLGPGARLSWRASRRSSLLGELLYEVSRTDGPTNHDNSNSVFFYVGYRYDLF